MIDPIIYGPDDKPVAPLKGFLRDCARRVPQGRCWTFVLPRAVSLPPIFPSDPDIVEAKTDHMILRHSFRRRRAMPDQLFEVYSFADAASLANYRAWAQEHEHA